MNKYFYVIRLFYPGSRSAVDNWYCYCPEMTYAWIKMLEIAAKKDERYRMDGELPKGAVITFFHRIEEDTDSDRQILSVVERSDSND